MRTGLVALARRSPLLVLTVAALAGTLAGFASSSSAGPTLRLPDLTQQVPTEWGLLKVKTTAGGRWHLGFRSAMNNVGTGQLMIEAHRDSTADPLLTADQVIATAENTTVTVPNAGVLRYDIEPTHQHFHFVAVDRYTLRSAKTWKLVTYDRKAGFCLGDRFLFKKLPNTPKSPPPYYQNECGSGDPTALTLSEGLSVGWFDVYNPEKEGQFLDITTVPAGTYQVVHTVNPARSIRESNYANNSASVIVQLSWPQGRSGTPRVVVTAECPNGDRACTKSTKTNYVVQRKKNSNY